jgi:GT2 family glycosyltransferase
MSAVALGGVRDRPPAPVTVAIPTLDRGEPLVRTIEALLSQAVPAAEVVVVDQTRSHEPAVQEALARWHREGRIRWTRLERASQPHACNEALERATSPVVLFLDDDIVPDRELVAEHWRAHVENEQAWAVVGQILQPGESERPTRARARPSGPLSDLDFAFNGAEPCWVENGMSGNLSVKRDRAMDLGGFDENFLPPVSYRFDSDFCKRVVAAGGRVRFHPSARVRHLRAPRGGTRVLGDHLASASPLHGLGDYYFALRRGRSPSVLAYVLRRPLREVRTRFHLRHPHAIPTKLLGEVRALLLALRLVRTGPRLPFAARPPREAARAAREPVAVPRPGAEPVGAMRES